MPKRKEKRGDRNKVTHVRIYDVVGQRQNSLSSLTFRQLILCGAKDKKKEIRQRFTTLKSRAI